MSKIIPKIIRVPASRLLIDKKNPRLPVAVSSKSSEEILRHIKRAYDLDELALSMTQNGYFEAEPLVAIPKDTSFSNNEDKKYQEYLEDTRNEFIVVEGNRRLATIQELLAANLLDSQRKPYPISDELRVQCENLPILVYPDRTSVLVFLGVHHLAGVRKWEVYERARYIVHLKRDVKYSMEKIQKVIGDRKNSAKKTYVCFRLIEMVDEYDENFNVKDAKDNFSFLLLALGQAPIREYIGLPSWGEIENIDAPIADEDREKLKDVFLCLFDSNYGQSFIRESRDITRMLSKILSDKDATQDLLDNKNIEQGFNMVGGVANLLNASAEKSKRQLETIVGKVVTFDFESNEHNRDEKQKLIDTISDIKTLATEIEKLLAS